MGDLPLGSQQIEAFHNAYQAARYYCLSLPIDEVEYQAEERAARSLRHYLGLGEAAAAYHARRTLYYRRDLAFHELLALRLPGAHIPHLLDSLSIQEDRWLDSATGERGAVLISVHYGPYSSLLLWWLARQVHLGRLDHLTVLIRTTGLGQYRLAPSRLREYESAGAWSLTGVELYDRDATAGGVVNELHARLGPGRAVLIFPDGVLQRDAPPGAIGFRLGNRNMAVPTGAGALAELSGAPVLPVCVRPHGEAGHAIVFHPPYQAASGQERVRSGLQNLIDATVMVDPAPWQPWMREGLCPRPQ